MGTLVIKIDRGQVLVRLPPSLPSASPPTVPISPVGRGSAESLTFLSHLPVVEVRRIQLHRPQTATLHPRSGRNYPSCPPAKKTTNMKVSLRMLDLAYVCWVGGSRHLAHAWVFSGPYVRRRIGEWRQLGPGMRLESDDKLTTTIF